MSLVGKVFTRLTVLSLDTDKSTKHAKRYICKCECGNIRSVVTAKLNNGSTKSCGCLRSERIKSGLNYKHGQRNTQTYQCWANMKTRCDNPESDDYSNYGQRGISYDKSWIDFNNFFEDMGSCEDGHTLERVDVNGNYSKTNCIWDTRTVQNHNRRKLPCRNHETYSEFIGVSWNKARMMWHAKLVKNKIKVYSRMFSKELDAAIAYDDHSQIHYGDRPNKTERLNVTI